MLDGAQANRKNADGWHPADVCVRWGDVRVATMLAAHGTVFDAAHAQEAERRGHRQLAQHLAKQVPRQRPAPTESAGM
eukprot:COSAG01_NODE_5398_length_4288_cov_3.443781_2_plen_78_part_00